MVALVDCLSANGFDMGTIMPLDEYVSSGGVTLVSPKLAELEFAEATDPKGRKSSRTRRSFKPDHSVVAGVVGQPRAPTDVGHESFL